MGRPRVEAGSRWRWRLRSLPWRSVPTASRSRRTRVAWRGVGRIVRRYRARQREMAGDPLDDLRIIGVDELRYRRHHEYVTTVVDHERGVVVCAGRGKSAETLHAFLKALGPVRSARLEAVTIDMSGAFIKAVSEASPNSLLIFDRFLVQRLAHEALDEVRRDELRKAVREDAKKLKRTRWALHKNPWNLTRLQREKLATLEALNRPIYQAHLAKEALCAILDGRRHNVPRRKLREWIVWLRSFDLMPLNRLANTIGKHFDGTISYIRTRLNNGCLEGLHGKARVITQRALGFHCASAFIAMLFLCCGGIIAELIHLPILHLLACHQSLTSFGPIHLLGYPSSSSDASAALNSSNTRLRARNVTASVGSPTTR